ncbi:MAG: autotransporter [Limisphaerales bacterium]
MKRGIFFILVIGFLLVLPVCYPRNVLAAGTADNNYSIPPSAISASVSDWPCQFWSDKSSYTVFTPQVDSWDGHSLVARSAVYVQVIGQSQPTYGVIAFKAITLVDKTTHVAALKETEITSADFPSTPGRKADLLRVLKKEFPNHAPVLSLDLLETSLAVNQLPIRTHRVNNAPPKIIFSDQPAILVVIDGPPAYQPVPGTELQRVINTRALLLKDHAGWFYLHVLDGYMEAPALDCPWRIAGGPPPGAAVAEKLAQTSPSPVDLLAGQPDPDTGKIPSLQSATAPVIYTTTTPAELITFKGRPDFVPIAGTHLLYAANTTGNVFKLLTDQQTYVLIAGRWYRAPTLNGPWQFVPGNKLAPDFAAIPDNSPKENVKASVPGTPQATEALIANSIPQGTAVARTTRIPDPQIDGAPQLNPIAGTPLYSVANSATPIIEVDAQSWYSCQNGVWYAATSVNGPWTVAASVPAVIYTIPPASPLHYLTYVQVYGSTPDVVYEGYTPGYLGTMVADDGTVVYGTGYDYPPWVGTVWYCPPITWGYGWDDCWLPWWGWGFGFGFGCEFGYGGFWYPPGPCWGFDRGWHNHDWDGGSGWRHDGWAAGTAGNIYDRHGFHSDSSSFGNREWANGYGHAYNSRTGQLAAGQQSRIQNAFNDPRLPMPRTGLGGNRIFTASTQGIISPSGSRFIGSPRQMSPRVRQYEPNWTRPDFNQGTVYNQRYYSSPRLQGNGYNYVQAGHPAARGVGGGFFHGMGNFFRGGGNGGFHESGGGWGGGGRSGGGGGWSGGAGGGGHR